jgi:hypothetical protein
MSNAPTSTPEKGTLNTSEQLEVDADASADSDDPIDVPVDDSPDCTDCYVSASAPMSMISNKLNFRP